MLREFVFHLINEGPSLQKTQLVVCESHDWSPSDRLQAAAAAATQGEKKKQNLSESIMAAISFTLLLLVCSLRFCDCNKDKKLE